MEEENNLIDGLDIICNTESNIDTQHIYIKNLDNFFLNYFKYFKNYSETENYNKMLKLFLFLIHLQDNYMFIDQLNAILYLDTTMHILNIINTYIYVLLCILNKFEVSAFLNIKILKIYNFILNIFKTSNSLIIGISLYNRIAKNNLLWDITHSNKLLMEFIIKFIQLQHKLYKNIPYKLYDIIEINFNNMFEFDKKMDIYNTIMEYADMLIQKDREGDEGYKYLIFGDNDNNRDKLLNNLGLLIIGIHENSYICILLYPILFTAFKEFQKRKEITKFGKINLYDDINIATKKPFRKGIFKGGGYGPCLININLPKKNTTIRCNCLGFEPSIEDDNICYHCNHLFIHHAPIKISKLKRNQLLSKLKNNAFTYNEINDENIYNFGNRIIDILEDLQKRFTIKIKLFKIPIDSRFIQHWRPMSIKVINDAFFNTDYNIAKKFIINSHGGVHSGMVKTIDLEDNEIVVMSCAPNEVTGQYSEERSIAAIFYDSNNHKEMLKYLFLIRPDMNNIPRSESEYTITNFPFRRNFCIYTKRCPNLSLKFYNDGGNDISKYIPRPIIEYPMQFSSKTIGDLLTRFPSMSAPFDASIESYLLFRNDSIDTNNKTLHLPNILCYLNSEYSNEYLQSKYYKTFSKAKSMSNAQIYQDSNIVSYIDKVNALIENLDNDLSSEQSERELVTYYDHINPQKQDRGTLLEEIKKIREYNSKLPSSAWIDNPNHIVIYFVSSCRRYIS
jgi:hypothetical protein